LATETRYEHRVKGRNPKEGRAYKRGKEKGDKVLSPDENAFHKNFSKFITKAQRGSMITTITLKYDYIYKDIHMYEKKKSVCISVCVCVCEWRFLRAPMRLLLIKLEVARTASGRLFAKNFLNFVVISFTLLEFLSANL